MPADASATTWMFLRNPAYKTFISPFQNNLLRKYIAEYSLELSRQRYFAAYPTWSEDALRKVLFSRAVEFYDKNVNAKGV